MATKKQVSNRNLPKERGRISRPSVGNFQSVLNAMQHAEDKKSVRAAQELERCNNLMFDLALGEGIGSKAGIKDRVMAIRWVQDAAKEYMDDYYASLEEEAASEGVDLDKVEAKANGTTGQVMSLIQTEFKEDE